MILFSDAVYLLVRGLSVVLDPIFYFLKGLDKIGVLAPAIAAYLIYLAVSFAGVAAVTGAASTAMFLFSSALKIQAFITAAIASVGLLDAAFLSLTLAEKAAYIGMLMFSSALKITAVVDIAIAALAALRAFAIPAFLEMSAAAIGFTAPFILIAAAIAATILALEDLYRFFTGGKSVTGDIVKWAEKKITGKDPEKSEKKITGKDPEKSENISPNSGGGNASSQKKTKNSDRVQDDNNQPLSGGSIFSLLDKFKSKPSIDSSRVTFIDRILSMRGAAGLNGIPGASASSAGASAVPQAMQNNSNVNRSIETNIGTLQINTNATDAPGTFRDAAKGMSYLFVGQANSGHM